MYIRFAVAPQAESGQHFEECQGFGGRWHGPGDGYPTANYCQPTLGKCVCCGAAAKMVALTAARQSWPPSTDMLVALICLATVTAARISAAATRERQHSHTL
jgi:hypothetical protein